jgi:hypothetical protein
VPRSSKGHARFVSCKIANSHSINLPPPLKILHEEASHQ